MPMQNNNSKMIYASADYLANSGMDFTEEQSNYIKSHQSKIIYDPFIMASRSSNSSNPFDFATPEIFKFPSFVKNNSTFADATDQRASDVIDLCKQNDLPIVVCWSGGIDSTVILSSIVKNFPKELKSRVVVLMTNASYFENPYFFENVIKKENFAVVDQVTWNWRSANVIVGEPADALWIQADIVELNLLHPGFYEFNLVKNPDLLLKFLSNKTTTDHAKWFYEMILEDSTNNGVMLESYEDFYWWMKFNLCYTGNVLRIYRFAIDDPLATFDINLLETNLIAWFHSDQYQCWSMNNRNNGVKFQGTISSYKMPAKEYIYSVDQNARYRDFKTKVGSGRLELPTISAIFADNTVIR